MIVNRTLQQCLVAWFFCFHSYLFIFWIQQHADMHIYTQRAVEKESGSHESLFCKYKKYSEECKMMLIKITTTDMKEKENEDKLGSELKIFAFYFKVFVSFVLHSFTCNPFSTPQLRWLQLESKKRGKKSYLNHHHHHHIVVVVVIIVHDAKVQTHERTKNSHKKYAKRQQQSKAVMSTKGIKEDDRLM